MLNVNLLRAAMEHEGVMAGICQAPPRFERTSLQTIAAPVSRPSVPTFEAMKPSREGRHHHRLIGGKIIMAARSTTAKGCPFDHRLFPDDLPSRLCAQNSGTTSRALSQRP
jgi:hypothetical protein